MNSKLKNIEFQITSCETNLHYLLGDEVPDQEKIDFMRSEIERLNKLKSEIS